MYLLQNNTINSKFDKNSMGKKRKAQDPNDEYEFDPTPKHMVTAHLKNQEKRLIIILEGAQLETVKVCIKFIPIVCIK